MDAWQYLLVLAGCVAVTLPLEFALRARARRGRKAPHSRVNSTFTGPYAPVNVLLTPVGVYRRWRLLLRAVLPVAGVFAVWDAVAIARGHWWFSPRYTTGALVGNLPVEELAFFLVIPVCGLLTYEAVGTVLGRRRTPVKPGGRHRTPTPGDADA